MPGPARLAVAPDAAFLAALASLPGVGPARLGRLLLERTPSEAWAAVCRGSAPAAAAGGPELAAEWRRMAAAIDPSSVLDELRSVGVGIVERRSPGYPDALRNDPEPPPVLFFQGDLAALGARRAAIVGTRQCTRYGHDIAVELGRRLASAGVTVVSGLAAGIDAAAHAGALAAEAAPPVAVVASGLDHPYPRQNTALWRRVAGAGLVLTEAPLGVRPERWRFPARNRIIAGLSEVVIVVESHARGGSLYTAVEAMERDIPVLAVPGPIRSAASTGTNRLIADGCHPVCAIDDVLELLDLVASTAPVVPAMAAAPASAAHQAVLDAIAWQPTTLETVVGSSALDIGAATSALDDLVEDGSVVVRGRWFERTIRGQGVRT